jgi:hypothetical protein
MSRHIHAEVLARYRSGDLGERRSRRVRAHLAGCRRCATASSGLAEVSHLLRAAAAPPMPADITARIEAALAAEAAQPSRAAGLPEPAQQPAPAEWPGAARRSGSDRPSAPGRRASRPALRSPLALRVLAGTAAAAVIVGGAYTAGQLAGGGSAGTAGSAAAGPSGVGGRSAAGRSSDSPMVKAPGAAPESTPGPAGAGNGSSGAASSTAGPALTYRAAHGTATFVPVAARAGFARQGLAGEVADLLRSTRRTAPLGLPSGASTSRSFSGIPVSTLEGCVSRVAAGGRVRLVDVDRYQGSKATIIVVAPAAGGPQQIWVVGPGCSGSDAQVITRATLPSAG